MDKSVLVSGASIAGLTTAFWMNRLGYKVTVVEKAGRPRTGGAGVNVSGKAIDIARRMGIYEQLRTHALKMERLEFMNADNRREGSIQMGGQVTEAEIEIERDKLVSILFDAIQPAVECIFNDSIASLTETPGNMEVGFASGMQRSFGLVIGCDGLHSAVRNIWFGKDPVHKQFLQHYFSLTIVPKCLVGQNTMQIYNTPGKVIMLNAYNNKTDVIFCFFSEHEIRYDYRNADQQRQLILEQFAGEGWRTAELLEETQNKNTAYFDQFCQVTLPSWTKGRVALAGDAGYCASPAAGVGASLAMIGATTLADALEAHPGDHETAFRQYNLHLRPFVDEVQATAVTMLNTYFIPRTEEAIRTRNGLTTPF